MSKEERSVGKVTKSSLISRLISKFTTRIKGNDKKQGVHQAKFDSDDFMDYIKSHGNYIFGDMSEEMALVRLTAFVETYFNTKFKDMFVGSAEDIVKEVFDDTMEETYDILCSGDSINIHGFGTFYLAEHKGHPIRFSTTEKNMQDYVSLKFKASTVFTKKLRKLYEDGDLVVNG